MFYEEKGIEQHVTVSNAHQINGTAERAICTIVTIGRSMLQHARLDMCFGGYSNDSNLYQKLLAYT